MKRILMEVAYDGTNYHGWQIQLNGITIESELNKYLSKLLKEEIHVIGASRTDSGVHALCNIAVFDTDSRIPADKMCHALNQKLPKDIRIQASREVAADFHPRHCDSIKTYQYQIWNAKIPIPMLRLYSHFSYITLDVALMQEACGYLVGKYDFISFCSQHSKTRTTIREITGLRVEARGMLITITVSGNGFLYNMVRIIVGTLMKIGQGVYPPQYMKEILDAKDRQKAGPVAPANGLTLMSYEFLPEY